VPSKSKRLLYRLFEWVGPLVFLVIGHTVRIKKINSEPQEELLKEKKPVLYCLWHGRMFVPIFIHRRQNIVPMISQHADGEMIARIVRKLGYGAVRGSSTRGGKEAFHEMLRHLKSGGMAAMIPDGPKGPRLHFKPGTLYLAQQSECYLVPVTFASRPCWRFKSWDRFVVPKPFARCVVCYGDPIQIPRTLSQEEMESWRQKLETTMVDLVKSAEAHFGGTDADV